MKLLKPVFASMPVTDISTNGVVPPEVKSAAKDWIAEVSANWVLIGGLAFGVLHQAAYDFGCECSVSVQRNHAVRLGTLQA